MQDWQKAFESLFQINMGCRQGERIVVFSDTTRPEEQIADQDRIRREQLRDTAEAAARFALQTFGNASFLSFPATPASGAEPPESLWREIFGDSIIRDLAKDRVLIRLLSKTATPDDLVRAREIVRSGADGVADVVIAMANNSTSHTRFRDLVNVAGGRFASLPHFDPEMFFTSMAVDWQALSDRTEQLALAVNQADSIHLSTPNGTRLEIGKRGRIAKGDTGMLNKTGSFGNLPAGEVYFAPLEGTTEGVMVIEYAPTRKLASPLTLTVEGGEVLEIKGDDPYRAVLEAKFAESRHNRNIAELGIGTNDRATRPDNVLEAEKILGTIHVALGDNSGFGGVVSTPFHEDYVFYQPDLSARMADGTETALLLAGKLLGSVRK